MQTSVALATVDTTVAAAPSDGNIATVETTGERKKFAKILERNGRERKKRTNIEHKTPYENKKSKLQNKK